MKAKQLNLGDIKWLPTDEEEKEYLYNVKGHYRIAAFILDYQFTQLGDEQIKNSFKKDAGEDFAFLNGKLKEEGEEDVLRDSIRTEIKSGHAD